MFRFESPWFLLILFFLAASAVLRRRKRFHPAMNLSSISAAIHLKDSLALKFFKALPLLKYSAFFLMVVAMARPQWGIRQTDVLTEGINIVLAVDISESMMAMDFQRQGKTVNRLEAVKGVVSNFIQKRTGDRIAMVVFGTHAYTQLPLTRDYSTIEYVLERLQIGAAGKRTAIGDAIGISLKRLEDIESKSNIIILLTDGRSNSGEITPDEAAEIAAQKNVKVYTIAVGGKSEAPFPIDHPTLGRRLVYQKVDVDEKSLQKIAEKTNAEFYRASDIRELEKIYAAIDDLEKTDVKIKVFSNYRDLYPYVLFPAFILLCSWIFLSNTRFLKAP